MKRITLQDERYTAWLSIAKARHFLWKARQSELKQYHITPRQAYIMFVMQELGHKTTLEELAGRADREIPTISIQMRRMEKDGLVKITKEDPKSNLLSYTLTKKGLDILRTTIKLRLIYKIMSVLSDKETKQLISMLDKIISEAEKY